MKLGGILGGLGLKLDPKTVIQLAFTLASGPVVRPLFLGLFKRQGSAGRAAFASKVRGLADALDTGALELAADHAADITDDIRF